MSLRWVCYEAGKSYLEVFVEKVCLIKSGAPVGMRCMICIVVSYSYIFRGCRYI